MSKITLKASDGHEFLAHEAMPAGTPRGGLIVVQEIFGVNPHIRKVTDDYAADGYHAISPGIFDRAERGVAMGYEKADVERGIAIRQKIKLEDMLLDIAAARDKVAPSGKVGIVGYCLGGSLAWMAAADVSGLSAAIGYYGGMVAANLGKTPRCPVMLHFGEKDTGIPLADVEKIKASADPTAVQVFVYPGAGHAFNREGNQAYHAESARLARERTLAFLRKYVG